MRTELESINELLAEASPRQPLGRLKAFEELREELGEPAWLSDVESELDLRDAISYTKVSAETRAVCEMEMQLAAKGGWRLNAVRI